MNNSNKYNFPIWRTIFADSINEIDFQNFGCHWTKDEFYSIGIEFTSNDISDRKRKGKAQFQFKTIISLDQVNISATKKSNADFPSESECVLKQKIILNNVILLNRKEQYKPFKVNIGTRISNWIN